MALTKKQLAERRKGIGASDASKIMSGAWYDLWAEKTGKVEPEDLSGVWPVQLGVATESLNLDWYARKTGSPVTLAGATAKWSDWEVLRCTLDGWDADRDAVIEAKHVNGFSKIDDVIGRYTPQVQHQMLVTGARVGVLSVIIGSNEPTLTDITRDDFWLTEYVELCHRFWRHVERDEPPSDGPAMTVQPLAPEKLRTVDMAGNNFWTSAAADWLANKDASKAFEKAAKDLKAIMEPDMGEAFGAGIKIVRQKNGLSIKEMKNGR